MTSDEDIAAAVDHAVAEFGRLDMMFSNAGIVGVIGRIVVDAGQTTIGGLGRFHQQPSAVLHEAESRT